jgi:hypothetical protein
MKTHLRNDVSNKFRKSMIECKTKLMMSMKPKVFELANHSCKRTSTTGRCGNH